MGIIGAFRNRSDVHFGSWRAMKLTHRRQRACVKISVSISFHRTRAILDRSSMRWIACANWVRKSIVNVGCSRRKRGNDVQITKSIERLKLGTL